MNGRLHLRPTREGQVALGGAALVAVVALVSGNNLLFILLSVLLALGIVELVLGAWNLGSLRVARVLPTELFASQPARGRFELKNPRRWLPALAVQVEELEGGDAKARFAAVPAGGKAKAWAAWRFESRGMAPLGRVRLSSAFPFGLVVRWREVELPAEVPVYPRPSGGPWSTEPGGDGLLGGIGPHAGQLGDFRGLRPYRAGDPVRTIHWPTSARMGEPMVVERTSEAAERVIARVADLQGAAWERELARAAGQVLAGFSRGAPVGLVLPHARMEPRTGAQWRRTLLDALARAPWRGNL